MLRNRMNLREWICFGAFGFLLSFELHAGDPSDLFEYLHQPASLDVPQRGSLAGEYGGTAWKAKDVTRGTFSLPLGISFPEDRGAMVYPVNPVYSPGQGLSEWGMGIRVELSIYRFRSQGFLDFKTDDLMSPWGHLVLGGDGDYYSSGFKSKVRVKMCSETEIQAFLEDGSVLTFGKTAVVQVPRGVYAWYLVEAKNSKQEVTTYEYEPIQQRFLYLTQILYGGVAGDPQYQVKFEYEAMKYPFKNYRPTELQELTRRVKKVDVLSKGLGGGGFSFRYGYEFEYYADQTGLAFYLKSIEKKYASGQSEPKKQFEFLRSMDFYNQVSWKKIDGMDEILEKHGNRLFSPKETTLLDLEQSGETQLEVPRKDYARLHRGESGLVLEELPARRGEIDPLCRKALGKDPTRRRLVRMRGVHSPLEVVVTHYPEDISVGTELVTCDLEGHRTGSVDLPRGWGFYGDTVLADLNQDGKPDMIQFYGTGHYKVIRNESTLDELKFSQDVILKKINHDFGRNMRVLDINGDGIPDVVVLSGNCLMIYYGKGNYEFELRPAFYHFIDQRGNRMDLGSDTRIEFQDLNNDGVVDVVAYGKNFISPFLSDGKNFVKVDLPALKFKELPFAESINRMGFMPLFADFTGSGNPQLTVIDPSHAYALELSSPGTGFLQAVDDGKGNRLEFDYERAKPEPGIGKRMPVLSGLKVKTAGKAQRSYTYEYRESQTDSENGSLLGFNQVTVHQGPHVFEGKFKHEDRLPSLFLSSKEWDQRQPGVTQVEKIQSEKKEFLGISYDQVQSEMRGYGNEAGDLIQSGSKNYIRYEDEFCPAQVVKIQGMQSLEMSTQYVKPPALSEFLTCLPAQVQKKGTHSENPGWDFTIGVQIQRDEWGHPTEIRSLGAQGRLLQRMRSLPLKR